MTPPFTFTFDVEDHRPDDGTDLRLLDATRRVLAFCADRGVVGTVFVVGEIVRDHPELVARSPPRATSSASTDGATPRSPS